MLALHRRADEIPPFRPRPVVVLHIWIAEQVLQHEPGVTRALADAAVRDHLLVARDPLALVKPGQLLVALEGAVFVACLRPWDASCAGDMAAALARLG